MTEVRFLRGVSSGQICKVGEGLEDRKQEACQTSIYTRNFITAIKMQVWCAGYAYFNAY